VAYIITNQGESRILSGGLAASAPGNMTASLICSALTFTATMTLTSVTQFTAGRAGNGICSALLNTTAWCVPFVSAGSAAMSASGNGAGGGYYYAFTAAPNLSAVGYAIWDNSNLYIVETFSDGPYYLSNAGDTVTVTPYVKLGSGSSN
jgi:hypothetical protein